MKKYKFLIMTLLLSFSLSGCGSSSYSNQTLTAESMSSKEYMDATFNEEYSYDEDKSEETIMGDKLVYNAYLNIETLEYSKTLNSIKEKIIKYNGIIESEEEYDNNYDWYYSSSVKENGTLQNTIKVRILSDKYQEFLNSLEGEGKIVSKTLNVENISKQYYETSSIVESLKIQEERLLLMMEETVSIEDMIAVESRLTEVQRQLNQYNSQLSSMNTDVKYSTITITIEEVVEYAAKTDTFFERLLNTIKETWKFFWDLLEGLLFLFIRLIPVFIVLTPIFIVVKFILNKINKKSKKL